MVLDNSVTMAWLMPDEGDGKTQNLLDLVVAEGAFVPPIWRLEAANTLLLAVRHRRLSSRQRGEALDYLAGLDIVIDAESDGQAWSTTLDLADRLRLTIYDACYLELAQRRALPLATLDKGLRKAAKSLDIPLLGV
jgi:predicted nucleic acid-binding protein